MKKELFGLSLIELQELLVAAGLKKFRAAQVYQWLYQKSVTAFDQMRNLSKKQTLRSCRSSLKSCASRYRRTI